MIDTFRALIPQMFLAARPNARLPNAKGRSVPAQPRSQRPRPGPYYSVIAPTHPDGSRAERRAVASKRVRPVPSSPESRAWLARHRAALAVLRCEAREAKRNAE